MYKNNTFIKLSIFLFLILSVSFAKSSDGKVVSIKDGDTIEILINDLPVRVRLYGIDCPEKKQAFGSRAKEFTSQLVFGKTVTLKEHGKDRYGRTIGEIILPDGRSLNDELVKSGFAWVYRAYSKDASLLNSENSAKQKKLGLWRDEHPVAPWDYRRNVKVSRSTSYYSASTDVEIDYGQCSATTKKGKRCKNMAVSSSGFCKVHNR